ACCRYNHFALDAVLALRAEHRIDAGQVARVHVTTIPFGLRMADPAPATPLAARFSIPWAVAAALVLGHAGLDAFRPAALADARIQALARRVEVAADPARPVDPGGRPRPRRRRHRAARGRGPARRAPGRGGQVPRARDPGAGRAPRGRRRRRGAGPRPAQAPAGPHRPSRPARLSPPPALQAAAAGEASGGEEPGAPGREPHWADGRALAVLPAEAARRFGDREALRFRDRRYSF